jgi:hypothetical protein
MVNDLLKACSMLMDKLKAKDLDNAYSKRFIKIEETIRSIPIKPETPE